MSEVHLKDLSKVYSEQIAESGVGYEPGKPATKLGAVTGIPKADQMSAAERIKKKTAEKRAALEKKHGKKMDDHPEYPKKKYVDEADMSGAPSIKDAKPAKKTKVKYDSHMKVMAPQVEKEEVEVNEGMHRDAKTGEVVDKAEVGKTYYPNMPKKKSSVALRKEKMKEALDPVGKEDGDVNNDGKKDSSDSYLMKRRAAIAKALGKKKQTEEVENPSKDLKGAVKKAVKRIDHNVSGDVDKNDKSMGNYGEFVPSADGKKKLTTKIGEGYSNWRTDIAEVMDDIESKPIKEKAVKNKVIINPKLSEAVEEIGGQVLEVTEVEVDEAMMAGPRKDAMKKKEYSAKSGSDRATAFNIGTRRDVSVSDPKIKSRGGRDDKRTGEGDRGMGNAAKRRMKEEASMSPQEIQLQKKKAMIDKLIATKRQQGLTKVKKSEEPAKAVGEEMSIADQMRISREAAAKRKPYQPGDREKQRAAQMRNAAKKAKKDTRSDSERMADAYASPRKGPGGATRAD